MFCNRYYHFYQCLAIIVIIHFVYIASVRDNIEIQQKGDIIKFTNNSNMSKRLEILEIQNNSVGASTSLFGEGLNNTMQKLNNDKVKATDPTLIELLRNYYIEKPSELPYLLDRPYASDPSNGQAGEVDNLLKHKEGGFYVECGAHDGEKRSNSLYFERFQKWSGILIEASPSIYRKLKNKHRKAFTLNACLNKRHYPSVVTFYEDSMSGKVLEGNYSKSYKEQSGKGRYVQVQCFPLYSILLALNQTRVDYLSLDVEGTEKDVLDSIPWNKVDIRTMSIGYDKWPGGKPALIAYLDERGYKYITDVKKPPAAADVIVVKQ